MTTREILPTRRWRLSGRTRKAMLTVHITSAVGWLGVDAVFAIFVVITFTATDPMLLGVSYYALDVFVFWALLTAGLTCLASGLVLGWSSKWGLLRYWWVAVKLVLNIVLTALVPLVLASELEKSGAYGRALLSGTVTMDPPAHLIFPIVVAPTALVFAIVLSVYKPWGLVRKGRKSA
jgi:hypothetical protein